MVDLAPERKQEAYISWRAAILALTEYYLALRDLENELGASVDFREMAPFAEDEDWNKETFEQFLANRDSVPWRHKN